MRARTSQPQPIDDLRDDARADALPGVLFVRGCPRSGTTLLADVLNERHDVGLLVEQPLGDVASRVRDLCWYEDHLRAERAAIARAQSSARSSGGGRYYALYDNLERMQFRARYPTQARLPHMLASLVCASIDKDDLRFIGSKTPGRWNYDELQLIREAFPVVKYVFIVRHPLDTVNSIINFRNVARAGLHVWPDKPVSDAIASYREGIALLFSTLCDAPQDTFVVKYEDLVRRPEWTLASLGEFLGTRIRDESQLIGKPKDRVAARSSNVLTTDEERIARAAFGDAIASWDEKKITGRGRTTLFATLADTLLPADRARARLAAPHGDRSLLGAGWSGSEPGGMRNDAPVADIFFAASSGGMHTLDLRLAGLGKPLASTPVMIQVNGRTHAFTLRNHLPRRLRLRERLVAGVNQVRFQTEAPSSLCLSEVRIDASSASALGSGIPAE